MTNEGGKYNREMKKRLRLRLRLRLSRDRLVWG